MKVMNFEPTPNPNAMKFNVSGRLITGGSRSFDSAHTATDDPLAEALFGLGKVTSVFYMPDFVTVNKRPDADWSALAPAVARTIEENAGKVAIAQQQSGPALSDDQMLDRINHVLDTQIRPALAGDGGGLEVLGLEGKTLRIRYQGACGSCPSAIAGTLQAIQNLLQAEIDEGITVTAA